MLALIRRASYLGKNMLGIFMGYDAWLEEPYQQMCKEADYFMDWCEREGMDPDNPATFDEYEAYCEEQAEIAAEDRAERRAERQEDDWDDWYDYD